MKQQHYVQSTNYELLFPETQEILSFKTHNNLTWDLQWQSTNTEKL